MNISHDEINRSSSFLRFSYLRTSNYKVSQEVLPTVPLGLSHFLERGQGDARVILLKTQKRK